jgi:hypothetical protein
VRSEQARIGARVRVGESGLRPEWRGLTGTISGRWGHPEYVSLDVRLEDARGFSGTTSWSGSQSMSRRIYERKRGLRESTPVRRRRFCNRSRR